MFSTFVSNFFPYFVSKAWFSEKRFYLCPGFCGFYSMQWFFFKSFRLTFPPCAKAA